MFGSGAMTNSVEDVTRAADVIMMVGTNAEEAHPVIGMQIRQAVERGARLIVVDPRSIWLADKADIHLRVKPGTNVAFANGMAHIIIRDGLVDEAFVAERTEGFDALKAAVADYTPERVAAVCGIDVRDLESAARMFAAGKPSAILYCLGVTEHSTGTDGVMSLGNLSMITGNLGVRGGGVNPLRGQNNVQGACDMGAAPADLTGYQKVANPEALAKFSRAWGVELSSTPGIMATDCFKGMIDGNIKGLFLFGEDPMRTDPDTNHVRKELEALDFFVVDDLFMTETAKLADVVLPGIAYAEKEGTFTNTERRVQRVRKAVEPPAGARPDTWIFTEVMRRMGYPQPHLSPAEVMDEVASLTPSYAGISHARLDAPETRGRGLQWPCTGPDHPGTPVMHRGGFTKGIGTMKPVEYRASAELPDADYPLILMTGRILSQYNAMAMTGRTAGINAIEDESFIQLNGDDAAALGVADGDTVRVSSRRGQVDVRADVSGTVLPGQTWMPLHFLEGGCNFLTSGAVLDPVSRTPEFKVCAVKVEKLEN